MSAAPGAMAQSCQEQSEAVRQVTTRIPLDGAKLGRKCRILVADYAGNEAVFEVDNGVTEKNTPV